MPAHTFDPQSALLGALGVAFVAALLAAYLGRRVGRRAVVAAPRSDSALPSPGGERCGAPALAGEDAVADAFEIVCRFRPDTTITFANRAYGELWGRSPSELVGSKWIDLVDPAQHEDIRAQLAGLSANNPVTYEETVIPGAHGPRWRRWTQRAILDADGAVSEILAIATDITELYETIEDLRDSEQRLSVALDAAGLGLYDWNIEAGTVERSAEWHALLGLEPNETLATLDGWRARAHPDDIEPALARIDAHMSGAARNWRVEYRLLDAQGEWVWVEDRGRVVERFEDGRARRAMGVVQDVRERHAAASELREARAVAERASSAKGHFLASMSHEIRTPLTAVIGYAELASDMLQGDRTEELDAHADTRDCLETVLRNGRHLQSLIDDVLDISKIEAGALHASFEHVDPGEIARDAVGMLAVRARTSGLELALEVAPDVPEAIRTDGLRLRQILVNLIGNAVKFTERGQVCVRLSTAYGSMRALDGDLPGELHVEVQDDGPGMSPETLALIFEPFHQGDASTTRRFGGTGLGLAISHRFAAMLGGRLEVESELGVGSTFRLYLPLELSELGRHSVNEPPPALPSDRRRRQPLRLSGRVLFAEDAADNRRLIGTVLERVGIDLDLAENGREAVDRVVAAEAAGRPYDLVLMDVFMPVLDGYAATRELRARGTTTPIIALTANAFDEERVRSLEAGCDAHCSKPIERESFLAAVATWLEAGRERSARRSL